MTDEVRQYLEAMRKARYKKLNRDMLELTSTLEHGMDESFLREYAVETAVRIHEHLAVIDNISKKLEA